jgi:hypothetical protein
MNDEELLLKALEDIRAGASRELRPPRPLSESTKRAMREEFQRIAEELQGGQSVPSVPTPPRLLDIIKALLLRPALALPLGAALALLLLTAYVYWQAQPKWQTLHVTTPLGLGEDASVREGGSGSLSVKLMLNESRAVLKHAGLGEIEIPLELIASNAVPRAFRLKRGGATDGVSPSGITNLYLEVDLEGRIRRLDFDAGEATGGRTIRFAPAGQAP